MTRNTGHLIAALGAPSLILLSGCGLTHINPDAKEDRYWRLIKEPRAAHIVTRQPQAAPPAKAVAKPKSPAKRGPVVAVFDVENKGTDIDQPTLERFTDYLAAQLVASRRYQVVPRDALKKRLQQKKADSYRKCFERSCQIEVGRELAAQKSLATVILKLGSKCMVTATLHDLKRATAELAASAKGSCTADAVVASLEQVVRRLTGKSNP